MSELLPIHAFILAGGKGSRMGEDKSLLELCGKPMVEIAVEKLRRLCVNVSVAGNRPDLSGFAPIVLEDRVDYGPAAGIKAGLSAYQQSWAMSVPVDVPLVPESVLRLDAARLSLRHERKLSRSSAEAAYFLSAST